LAVIKRRKWLFIIPIPIVAAVAFGLSYLTQPEFESSTIIQIDLDFQLINEVRGLIGDPSNVSSIRGQDRANMLQSMYNEITSTHYAELLDQRMTLTRLPEIEQAALRYVQLQPSMTIDGARLTVLQERLKAAVSVNYASSDQIRISVTSTDAMQARDLANHLGDIFIAEKIRQDAKQIRSSQDFSDVQLERYERQVEDKLAEIATVEQQLGRLRNSEETSSETNRAEIQSEIDQTLNEIEDLRQDERTILGRLRGVENLNAGDLKLAASEAKQSIERDLVSRLSEIGDLLSRYTWRHPQVINFKVRQNDLLDGLDGQNRILVSDQYAQFDQSVRNDLTSLFNTRDHLDYLYSKKPYLESAINDLNPAADQIPVLEAKQSQLERELQAAVDIRDRFRRQQESSTISQAFLDDRASTKYRQVEPAKVALAPFKPNRMKLAMMGLLFGIAIGGAAIVLVEMMDNSFKKVEDVEAVLGLKVIGVSPKIDFEKQLSRQ
jgi:uncharacterized protein involved in exopolysaccharide biosynthesis